MYCKYGFGLIVLKVISKDGKIQIRLMFYLETILHCSMKLPREGTNELSKDRFD